MPLWMAGGLLICTLAGAGALFFRRKKIPAVILLIAAIILVSYLVCTFLLLTMIR